MLRRNAIASAAVFLALAVLGWIGGCSVESPCDNISYPSASGLVYRVAATCGQDSGSGSRSAPFRTIAAALGVASSGSTVVIADGSYEENLNIPAGVAVLGTGMDRVRVEAAGQPGIVVTGKGATRISGLTVNGAKGFGIRIDTAEVALSGVRVSNTVAGGAQEPGHGIRAIGAARLDLQSCQLMGNAGVGLVALGSGPVSIIDPLFVKNPSGTARGKAGSTAGIIDPLFLPHSIIKDNAGGGVAIIDPLFLPTPGSVALQLTATNVQHNGRYGVGLFGAGAAISRSAVQGTYGAGSDSADGVVVAPGVAASAEPATVAVQVDETSVVTGNGRAGILISANATVQIGAEISLNGRGGVWAQGASASATVASSAWIAGNTMVGVAATAGGTLTVEGARIADTGTRSVVLPGAGGATVELADGIGIFGQAHGRISGATLSGNKRAGILARNCATLTNGWPDLLVEKTSITGSQYGVVVNGAFPQAAIDAAEGSGNDNHFDGLAAKASNVDLPAQDNLCEGGTGCSPTP